MLEDTTSPSKPSNGEEDEDAIEEEESCSECSEKEETRKGNLHPDRQKGESTEERKVCFCLQWASYPHIAEQLL